MINRRKYFSNLDETTIRLCIIALECRKINKIIYWLNESTNQRANELKDKKRFVYFSYSSSSISLGLLLDDI